LVRFSSAAPRVSPSRTLLPSTTLFRSHPRGVLVALFLSWTGTWLAFWGAAFGAVIGVLAASGASSTSHGLGFGLAQAGGPLTAEIGRSHVCTPVTRSSRNPASL